MTKKRSDGQNSDDFFLEEDIRDINEYEVCIVIFDDILDYYQKPFDQFPTIEKHKKSMFRFCFIPIQIHKKHRQEVPVT